MQIAKISFLGKTNRAITAAARNTSCDRGWLQVFTHIVCGSFTVTSFVLILLIAFEIFPKRPNEEQESRCQVNGCRVVCHNAPFYEEYEDDIYMAVMNADTYCEGLYLNLIDPAFTNESLPQNWLSTLRHNVKELSLIGGNLRHIPENAFSAAFARNLKTLFLENVIITTWTSHTLLGLVSLEKLFINNCKIFSLEKNVLKAVSLTLKSLNVVKCGSWDPAWVTGLYLTAPLPELSMVDFSYNIFGSILGNTSFTRLRYCKSLYLSYSGITHLGPGAFDNLNNIEYINLDNNFLKSIPSQLFSNLISTNYSRVRLNLNHNYWHCDCALNHLIELTQAGILIVDPFCYSPNELEAKTFTEFKNYCLNNEPRKDLIVDINSRRTFHIDNTETISNVECQNDGRNTLSNLFPVVVSPFREYACSGSQFNATNLRMSTVVTDFYDAAGYFWMKASLIIKLMNLTMLELRFTGLEGYGLVWYKSSCPNEIFCVNIVPEIIRLYNLNVSNEYIFCPIILRSGAVVQDLCTAYNSNVYSGSKRSATQILMIILIAVSCLLFGATCLYLLIRKYPYLLKGSKRVLFVKHKTVDALVLPPKVPLRTSMLERSVVDSNDMDNIAEPSQKSFIIGGLSRMNSVRSSHSFAPSYISALQPTDEQLSDWRLKHGADNFKMNSKATSTMDSEGPISILSGSDNLYFSIDEISRRSNFIGDYLNENIENHSFGLF